MKECKGRHTVSVVASLISMLVVTKRYAVICADIPDLLSHHPSRPLLERKVRPVHLSHVRVRGKKFHWILGCICRILLIEINFCHDQRSVGLFVRWGTEIENNKLRASLIEIPMMHKNN